MNISWSNEMLVLELNVQERTLFMALLRAYPLLNPDYHETTKTRGDAKLEASREMLCAAMAEQKARHKQRVEEFLRGPDWVPDARELCRVELRREAIEWLLQVINDVRVGCWVRLGRPDLEHEAESQATAEQRGYLGLMELAALFQSVLLNSVESLDR